VRNSGRPGEMAVTSLALPRGITGELKGSAKIPFASSGANRDLASPSPVGSP
jgi:hypothetical protein